MDDKVQLAIIGAGNIGRAMAVGLTDAGRFSAGDDLAASSAICATSM